MPAFELVSFPLRPGVPVAAPPKSYGLQYAIAPRVAPFEECGTSAVVHIAGPLCQHGWDGESYDNIRKRVAAALDSPAANVVLCLNSPGGDFQGSIELAADLKAMAASKRKRLLAFTDSNAMSAAYAIACAAESITITPSAMVGSIGVFMPLVDATAQDKAMGLNFVFVASGTQKAAKNPHVALTEETIDATQAQVDVMAGLFFAHVAASRGLGFDAVKALQGAEYFGVQAQSLRLADSVVNSWESFLLNVDNNMTSGGPMAKTFDEAKAKAREAMAKVAEGEDEDAKAAKAWLSKMGDDEEVKAEGDDAEPEAKAEEAAPEKKKEEEPESRAATAGGNRLAASTHEIDLAAQVQALRAEIAAGKEATAREKLLASRPDFGPEVKATLEAAPLDVVRKACAEWPRSGMAASSVNATFPNASRGEPSLKTEGIAVHLTEAEYVAQKMGGKTSVGGIKSEGLTTTFEVMSREAAQAAVRKLNGGK